MFHDLSVLLKYKVFMENSNSKKRQKNSLLFLVLFCFGFLFLISKNLLTVYNELSVLTFANGNFGDIYMNFIITFFSLFFILSFSSMMSFHLKKNEEIDFLLTLPIKKSSIVTYNLIISGISMLLYLVIYLAPVIAFFSNKTPSFIIFGSIGVLMSVLLLVFISSICAVLLSSVASQKVLRVLMIIINLIYAGAYILMFQTLPGSILNSGALPDALMKADGFFRSGFNIFSIGINAGERPYYLIILSVLLVLFGLLYFYMSDRLNFKKIRVRNGKSAVKESAAKSNTLLRKELMIYRRNEQLIYYIFYPVGFGLLMGFINKDFFTSLFTISIMGCLFISMQTAYSMSLEGGSIELIKMLPIDLKDFIRVKLLVPVVINFLLLVIVFFCLNLFIGVRPLSLILLPVISVVQLMASLSGMAFTLKKPPQQMSNPNAFMRSTSFLGQFLVILVLSMITVLPVSIAILQTAATVSPLINALLIGVSCAGLFIIIILSVRLWNTIKKKVFAWC
ncbi:MAG TPA: hypothetical protein PLO84_11350 [Thermotogota bacterium]|nr:hypothetical protein [Thermotogota bacterium]HPJ89705.1 hypothetical protein [Thermotogota bacterium]